MKSDTVGILLLAVILLLNACQPISNQSEGNFEFLAFGKPIDHLEGLRLKATKSMTSERILISSETQGILLVDANGEVLDSAQLGDSKSFDVLTRHEEGGSQWVAFVDELSNTIELKSLQDDRLVSIDWPQNWAAALGAVCLSDGGLTSKAGYENNRLFAWVVTQSGIAHQLLLKVENDSTQIQLVRELALGEGVSQCDVDERNQRFFWSQEGVGLLSLNSDPEKDEERILVDADVPSDIQVLHDRDHLIATVDNTLFSYDLSSAEPKKNALVNFSQAFSSVLFVPQALNSNEGSLWAIEEEGDQLFRSTELLSLSASSQPIQDDTFYVMPSVETQPVKSVGDAADDPEIWVNQRDPDRSLILATDKKSGLWVHNLDGKAQQFLDRGRLNNVDIRYGVNILSEVADVAMATNRTTNNIDLFKIDKTTGELTLLGETLIDDSLGEPYGGCLYTSVQTGNTYVFVNNKDGLYQQWELGFSAATKDFPLTASSVNAKKVRQFSLQGQPEGCVADDQAGVVYLGEEDRGIWKMRADASQEPNLQLLDEISNGHIVADVEGMSLYQNDDGSGYLVVSSQGDNAYVLYDRQTDHYVGRFRVFMNADKGIDGSSETDGLAVSSANLGGVFSSGLLVVQDGRNRLPEERQNFKLVAWSSIEQVLIQDESVTNL